jgi:hypothetical protein
MRRFPAFNIMGEVDIGWKTANSFFLLPTTPIPEFMEKSLVFGLILSDTDLNSEGKGICGATTPTKN